MRNDKPLAMLRLARRLARSGEGMILDEMARDFDGDQRTAERMRDAVCELFSQLEGIADGRSDVTPSHLAWRISKQDAPTSEI